MHQEQFTLRSYSARRLLALAAAVLVYLLSLVGVVWTPGLGAVVNGIALLALGGALSWLVSARLGSSPQRLSVRVQTRWRRERTLAVAGVATVYLALIFGAIVTMMG